MLLLFLGTYHKINKGKCICLYNNNIYQVQLWPKKQTHTHTEKNHTTEVICESHQDFHRHRYWCVTWNSRLPCIYKERAWRARTDFRTDIKDEFSLHLPHIYLIVGSLFPFEAHSLPCKTLPLLYKNIIKYTL